MNDFAKIMMLNLTLGDYVGHCDVQYERGLWLVAYRIKVMLYKLSLYYEA